MWTQDARPALNGKWLAWQTTIENSVDPADAVEPVEVIKPGTHFQGKAVIDCKNK